MRKSVVVAEAKLALVGCKPKPGALHVVSHRPSGKSEASQRAQGIVAVTFDRPMIKEALVGKAARAGALLLGPSLPGELSWADRQTLVFHAAQPLKRSTNYRVRVDGNLQALDGSRLGPPFEWRFTTEQLE